MSNKSLDSLIATIRTEAIEAADNKAMEILDRAHDQAQRIVNEARAKRNELLSDAETEVQLTLKKGESALNQAARDLKVKVRNDLLLLLKNVLEREVETSFTPDLMEKVILKVMGNLGSQTEVKLPASMETELSEKLLRRLQESCKSNSITIDSKLPNGFSIAETDQGWSYYISSKEVADLLNDHLSPKWVAILKEESD
jgi:vacuolar-type H+-ATPase subunit H